MVSYHIILFINDNHKNTRSFNFQSYYFFSFRLVNQLRDNSNFCTRHCLSLKSLGLIFSFPSFPSSFLPSLPPSPRASAQYLPQICLFFFIVYLPPFFYISNSFMLPQSFLLLIETHKLCFHSYLTLICLLHEENTWQTSCDIHINNNTCRLPFRRYLCTSSLPLTTVL